LGPAIEDRLHFRRVPGHHDIAQQAQCIRNRLHFILTLGLMASGTAGVNQALQGVGCLAAIEDS
jgi:hypothetical protein